jgi:hypothetical protein
MTHSQASGLTTEIVAVLGDGGTMGFAMARNIARAGPGTAPAAENRDRGGPRRSAARGKMPRCQPRRVPAQLAVVVAIEDYPC